MLDIFGVQSGTLGPEVMEAFKFHFKAGHGGYPLVGTPEQIVDAIERLSKMGVDGMLMSSTEGSMLSTQLEDTVHDPSSE